MTIVVGYVPTPVGQAALEAALTEARRREEQLLVVQPRPSRRAAPAPRTEGLELEEQLLRDSGVDYELRSLDHDSDPADVILDAAVQSGSQLIVLGLRRRSPVGKIIMASTAQRVLLESPCPVLCVKADYS